jgi:DNA-binding CsgD family transcriptional regulator
VSSGADRDAEAVLDTVHDLAGIDDPRELVEESLAALLRLLHAEVASYNHIDARARSAEVLLRPCLPRYTQLLDHVDESMEDHPLLQHLTRPGTPPLPQRLSDVISPSAWRRTRTYAEVLRPMGTPHMLAIPLRWEGMAGTSYAVMRSGTDFRVRERELATALQCGLAALHRRLPAAPGEPAGRGDEGRLGTRGRQAGITPRQHDVLRLLAEGCTADSIARALGMSPRTVHKHLQRLYTTLDVHDRLSAVNRARAIGLL